MGIFGNRNGGPQTVAVPSPAPPNGAVADTPRRPETARHELKTKIHRQLIERLDLSKLATLPTDVVQQQIRRIVEDLVVDAETPRASRQVLAKMRMEL